MNTSPSMTWLPPNKNNQEEIRKNVSNRGMTKRLKMPKDRPKKTLKHKRNEF